jgi:hypothetical protein
MREMLSRSATTCTKEKTKQMALFRKKLKWWFRDLWAFIARKKLEPEPKTICAFYCRECGRRHRLEFLSIGLDGIDVSGLLPHGLKMKCPKTGEMVYPAQDDFVFLTERESDLHWR